MKKRAKKIIVMTRLALYDKHQGRMDRQLAELFRHDYIYAKNLWNRLAVGSGAVALVAIYWLRNILLDGVDVFELYMRQHIADAALFVLAVMAAYTVIGIIQGTREYYHMEERLRQYEALVEYLERADEREQRAREGEARRRPERRPPPDRSLRPEPGSRLDRPGSHITRLTQDTGMRPKIQRPRPARPEDFPPRTAPPPSAAGRRPAQGGSPEAPYRPARRPPPPPAPRVRRPPAPQNQQERI